MLGINKLLILLLFCLAAVACGAQNRTNINRKLQKAPGANYLILSDSTQKVNYVHKDSIVRFDDLIISADGSISAPNFTIEEIDSVGAPALITKEYFDANNGGGGGTVVKYAVSETNTGMIDLESGLPIFVTGYNGLQSDMTYIDFSSYEYDLGILYEDIVILSFEILNEIKGLNNQVFKNTTDYFYESEGNGNVIFWSYNNAQDKTIRAYIYYIKI